MKLIRLFLCSAMVLSLTACLSVFNRTPSTPDPVVVKETKSASANAQTFHLYVGSTQKAPVKALAKQKKTKKASAEPVTVEVKSGDVTYYTTGSIASREDIKAAFVAKTISDQPALGIRLSKEANARLSKALATHKVSTVLASLNKSVFSKVDNAGAKLQDGVLLLPMQSLSDARDVARLLRNSKN